MKFWWVNHKQTFKEEIEGGYIWSPKCQKNGSYNQFYENMKYASKGDVIFSYANKKISKLGIVTKEFIDSDKPSSFNENLDWDIRGYKVFIEWHSLTTPLYPQEYLSLILPLLPSKYSPLSKKGFGNQGCYLASISEKLANVIFELLTDLGNGISLFNLKYIDSFLPKLDNEMRETLNINIPITVKQSLINSRRGQGKFRERVIMNCEGQCVVTGVNNEKLLIASHIKPWKKSSNIERLDGNNGLLLSPHVDKLFDNGFISFNNNGTLKYQSKMKEVLEHWNIDISKVYMKFNTKQKEYLDFHRKNIFLK